MAKSKNIVMINFSNFRRNKVTDYTEFDAFRNEAGLMGNL